MHNSCQSPGSQPAQGQSPTPNTANLHKSTYPSERKELTGKAGGEPCCLSVSEPDVCVVAGDRCLPTNCTHRPNGPTLPSAHPRSQAVRWLSSLLGHGTAARRPGQSPRAVTVPRAWGWQGQPSSGRNSGSYTQLSGPKFVQFPTCPALQGRAGLGYLLWSNLRVMRTPLLGLNLFFQWTGLKSEMLPVTQTARCLLWGGIPLETQKLNLKKWALEAQVLLQPWYWRAARTPGLFLLWRESNISHNSLQHLCACSPK